MKRTIKALTAVLVVATLCLGLLAGCASGGLTGHWKGVSMTTMGVEMDISSMNISVDIREDGTATYTTLGIATDTTWTKLSDTSFTMQTATYTLQGGQLVAESDDGSTTIIFTR